MQPTAWRYLVRYRGDVLEALAEARRSTFARGAFFHQYGPGEMPSTIEEVIRRAGARGTHSILDVHEIGVTPAPGRAVHAPPEQRLAVYGTLEPVREDVEGHVYALAHTLDPGHAVFVFVHGDAGVSHVCFEGLTGG